LVELRADQAVNQFVNQFTLAVMKSAFVPGNARERGAETELHGAAWVGNIKRAKQLIAAGNDVNCADSAAETPLHGAAACGRAKVIELLLSAGARHNIPGTTGLTPLHWAAGWGNLATVKVLVRAGADVSAKNEFGRTAAEVAREHGQVEVAAFLDASPLTARSTATRKSSARRQRGR